VYRPVYQNDFLKGPGRLNLQFANHASLNSIYFGGIAAYLKDLTPQAG